MKLRDHLPVLFNNPIIMRENLARLRSNSMFIFFGLIQLASSFLTIYFLYGFRHFHGRGEMLFGIFNVFLFSLITCIIPFISASKINSEIEQNTWELLISSPLSPISIYFGKFLSSIVFIWLIFFSFLPYNCVFIYTGGVSFKDVLFVFFCLTELTFLLTSIGLFCSCLWQRSIHSITAALIFGLLYLVIIPFLFPKELVVSYIISPIFYMTGMLSPLPYQNQFTTFRPFLYIINKESVTFMHIAYTLFSILFLSFLSIVLLYKKYTSMLDGTTNAVVIQKRNVSKQVKQEKDPYEPKYSEGRMAIYQKDYYTITNHRWISRQNWALICIGILINILILFVAFNSPPSINHLNHYLIILIYTTLLIIPFASNCICIEKDQNTLDLLLVSKLKTKDIVFSKFYAGLSIFLNRYIALGFVFFFYSLIIAIFVNPSLNYMMELMICCFVPVISACFILSIGILISTIIKKSSLTYVIMVIFVLLYQFILPLFNYEYNNTLMTNINFILFPYPLMHELLFHYPPFSMFPNMLSFNSINRFEYIHPIVCFIIQSTIYIFASSYCLLTSAQRLENRDT